MAKTIIDALVNCELAEKLHDGAFATMRDIAASKQCLKYTQGDRQQSAEAFLRVVKEDETQWMQYHADLPQQYEEARYLLTTALEVGVDIAGKTAAEIQNDLTKLHQFCSRTHNLAS